MKYLTLALMVLTVTACANRPAKFANGDAVCIKHFDKCGIVKSQDEKQYKVAFVGGNKTIPEKRLEAPKQKSQVTSYYSK